MDGLRLLNESLDEIINLDLPDKENEDNLK
jgi:hypothetical protein